MLNPEYVDENKDGNLEIGFTDGDCDDALTIKLSKIDALGLGIDLVRGNKIIDTTKEYVLCSSIWVDDNKKHIHQPRNIKKGFVVSGWRHCNCLTTIRTAKIDIKKRKTVQGFLTSNNIFLDRPEAFELAKKCGQINKNLIGSILTSEDLW